MWPPLCLLFFKIFLAGRKDAPVAPDGLATRRQLQSGSLLLKLLRGLNSCQCYGPIFLREL